MKKIVLIVLSLFSCNIFPKNNSTNSENNVAPIEKVTEVAKDVTSPCPTCGNNPQRNKGRSFNNYKNNYRNNNGNNKKRYNTKTKSPNNRYPKNNYKHCKYFNEEP